MGLAVLPECLISVNGPTFSPRVAKDVALANADLPMDAQEQKPTVAVASPSQALTPASELSALCQRPFAKTHKLIEMESHRSSKKASHRTKLRERPKPAANNNHQLFKFKRKDARLINVVSETRNASPPPQEIISVNVDQTKATKNEEAEAAMNPVQIAK